MTDIATLGLKLDANGFVAGARQASSALDNLGEASTKVQRKVERLATEGAFAFGSLASSGSRDLGTILHSVSALGFAFGTGFGALTLGVAAIGDAFADTRRRSKEEQDKMLKDLQDFEQKFSQQSLRVRIAVLERRESEVAGRISSIEPESPFFNYSFRQLGQLNSLGREQEGLIRDLGALRTKLVELERTDAGKKQAEDFKTMHDAIRAVRDEHDRWWMDYQSKQPTVNDLIADYAKRLGEAGDEHRRFLATATDIGDIWEKPKKDLDEILLKIHLWLKGLDEATAKAKAADQLRIGGFAGVAGGILNAMGGPFGSIASGALAGIGGGAPGIAMGAVGGLVTGLLGLADAASRAREQEYQLQLAHQSFIDGIRHQLGQLTDKEFDVKNIQREFEARRRALVGNAANIDPSMYDQLQRQLEYAFGKEEAARRIHELQQLNDLEKQLTDKRRQEADEVERLNSAIRNAPSGFFIERYLQRLNEAGGAITPGFGPSNPFGPGHTTPGGSRSGMTTMNVVVPPGGIVINGNQSPMEMAKQLAKGLQLWANATGGTGITASQALNMLPVS